MAIHSHDFGGLRLTGEDADAFVRQVKQGRRNKRAAASLTRGLQMAAEFERKGRVQIKQLKARGRRGA